MKSRNSGFLPKSTVDLSLEEIIGFNKKYGGGGFRGGSKRGGRRPATLPCKWKTEFFEQITVVGGSKLHISNLDLRVSDNSMKGLFADQFGALKRCVVHRDKSGHSLGTAEVHFISAANALRAQQKYNNFKMAGCPMHIEIFGGGSGHLFAQPRSADGGQASFPYRSGDAGSFMNSSQVRGGGGEHRGGHQRWRGGSSGGRHRGWRGGVGGGGDGGGSRGGDGGHHGWRGGGRGRKQPPTEAELDAELDAYKHASNI